jgi:hypothetical protein
VDCLGVTRLSDAQIQVVLQSRCPLTVAFIDLLAHAVHSPSWLWRKSRRACGGNGRRGCNARFDQCGASSFALGAVLLPTGAFSYDAPTISAAYAVVQQLPAQVCKRAGKCCVAFDHQLCSVPMLPRRWCPTTQLLLLWQTPLVILIAPVSD